MPKHLASSLFLKLAFFALLTPHFVFSSGEVETLLQPDKEFEKVVAAPAPQLSFESLPSEIISLILDKLSRKDLVNLRAVEEKLRDMITPLITNVGTPANAPNKEQFENFFKDLTASEYWKRKKPSEAFVNLFRHAPVKILAPSEQISADGITAVAPALPIGLDILSLNNSNIGDKGLQALAPHLPATLQVFWLNNSNIGEVGVQALALHLPATFKVLWLDGNNIGDAGLTALLEAIPRTDLTQLIISVPSNSPLRQQFENLRNRQNDAIIVKLTPPPSERSIF